MESHFTYANIAEAALAERWGQKFESEKEAGGHSDEHCMLAFIATELRLLRMELSGYMQREMAKIYRDQGRKVKQLRDARDKWMQHQIDLHGEPSRHLKRELERVLHQVFAIRSFDVSVDPFGDDWNPWIYGRETTGPEIDWRVRFPARFFSKKTLAEYRKWIKRKPRKKKPKTEAPANV